MKNMIQATMEMNGSSNGQDFTFDVAVEGEWDGDDFIVSEFASCEWIDEICLTDSDIERARDILLAKWQDKVERERDAREAYEEDKADERREARLLAGNK